MPERRPPKRPSSSPPGPGSREDRRPPSRPRPSHPRSDPSRHLHPPGHRGPTARARTELERHVIEVQQTIRTCADCGLCCTDAFNSVEILPIEAHRVAQHLESLPEARREALVARLEATVARYELDRRGSSKRRYTCSFLEPDASCCLPLGVKPVACLAFNPLTPDACDMEPDHYHAAHDPVELENRAHSLPPKKLPIPLAILAALRSPPLRMKRR